MRIVNGVIVNEGGEPVILTFEKFLRYSLDGIKLNEKIVETTDDHFIVYNGDIIAHSTSDEADANRVYDSIEAGTRPSESVALYKMIKEKRKSR